MNTDKINSYGQLFRFITPILVTIILFILGMIKQDLGQLKIQFDNHLSEHKKIEITLENRLSRIETKLEFIKNK